MKKQTYRFPKSERIVSQKQIDLLFAGDGSHSVAAFPVRAVFATLPAGQSSESPCAMLASVPKRRFKHAVDRNRVKRQLREAWRHHSQTVSAVVPPGTWLRIAFVWMAGNHFATAEVDQRVESLLQRIAKKIAPPALNPQPSTLNPQPSTLNS